MIKAMNITSYTQYEQHKQNQDEFKQLMPLLSQLSAKEQRDLVHMLDSESVDGKFLSELCSNNLEEQLAKISEEENYAVKNAYRHYNKTTKFAEAKK